MKQLRQFADFVRRMSVTLRFGELSRAPLKFLRLELIGQKAQFDWLVRSPDTWAAQLPRPVREREASIQALHDAMALRKMFFDLMPDVQSADFRAFRQTAREPPQLVISGTVTGKSPAVGRVASPVMKAKLYGFNFRLEDGVLGPLQMEDGGLKLMISA